MTSAQLQSVYIVEDVQRNRPIISAEQLISLQNWNYKYFFKLTSLGLILKPNSYWHRAPLKRTRVTSTIMYNYPGSLGARSYTPPQFYCVATLHPTSIEIAMYCIVVSQSEMRWCCSNLWQYEGANCKRGSRGGALVATAPRGMNRKKKKKKKKREKRKKEKEKERKKDLLQSCYATSAVNKLLTPPSDTGTDRGWGSIAWSV